MQFSELKTNVNSSMGRDDVPDFIYALTTAGINRDLRLLDMERSGKLVVTGGSDETPVVSGILTSGLLLQIPGEDDAAAINPTAFATLPDDFNTMRSAFTIVGGCRRPLEAVTDQATGFQNSNGAPVYYAVRDNQLQVWPEPDAEYSIYIHYSADLANFSADTDTNAVIARYPDLYLYQALTHAAVWAKDSEAARDYGTLYGVAIDNAKKDDRTRRFGTGIKSRSARL